MKILLYSYWFWPGVGGIESISQVLARTWVESGHRVTVVTQTPANQEQLTLYNVIRQPPWLTSALLVRDHDLVFVNGSAIHYFPLCLLFRKPFVWTHHDYAFKLGKHPSWSVEHQAKNSYSLESWVRSFLKSARVVGRRLVAHMADANIAITHHMALRQPLPRQQVIHSPIDYQVFAVGDLQRAKQAAAQSLHTFTYLGRLIKEKGVHDLLHALVMVNEQRQRDGLRPATLQVIGDGPERANLEQLAKKLKVDGHISWCGYKTGTELVDLINRSGIFVIPSRWEEPMGLVVLELMAAGKPLIVSLRGGLSECAGDACLTFPNGDPSALAEAMRRLANDMQLQEELIAKALLQIEKFRPEIARDAYLELFEELLRRNSPDHAAKRN